MNPMTKKTETKKCNKCGQEIIEIERFIFTDKRRTICHDCIVKSNAYKKGKDYADSVLNSLRTFDEKVRDYG